MHEGLHAETHFFVMCGIGDIRFGLGRMNGANAQSQICRKGLTLIIDFGSCH